MRLVTLLHHGSRQVGVLRNDEVVLVGLDDLRAVVVGGDEALSEVRARTASSRDVIAWPQAQRLAPIEKFNRDILCTGWNYWDHFHEGVGQPADRTVTAPSHPTFFTKGPGTVIGPNDDISFDPSISAEWDFEAELALVIGRTGRSIPAGEAMRHVWGYMLANDVSQRDLQRAHGGQWLKGKSIDETMPIGPCLVTADEIDPTDVQLESWVNGVQMQSASTRLMAFPIPELLAELSWGMTLRPGDLLLTGTPSGVGSARTPPVFLQDGDEVVVTGSGIGQLRNRVRARALSVPWSEDAALQSP